MAGDRNSRNRRLVFEAMEDRKLLSTTYTWTGLGGDGGAGTWSNNNNWNPSTSSPGNATHDVAVLVGGASVKMDAVGPCRLDGLNFSNGASNLDLDGQNEYAIQIADKPGNAAGSLTVSNSVLGANNELRFGSLSVGEVAGDTAQLTFTQNAVAENVSGPILPSPDPIIPPVYSTDMVGNEGTGTLTVSNGASLTTNPLRIGDGDGGWGSVLVTGPSSSLTVVSNGITVGTNGGSEGVGNLGVQQGATVSVLGGWGDVNVSGKGDPSSVLVQESQDGQVSTLDAGGLSLTGVASAQFLDGGTALIDGSANMGLEQGDQSNTSLTVSGTGSQLIVGDNFAVGADGLAALSIIGNGVLKVAATPAVGFPPGNLVVSSGTGADTNVTIDGGQLFAYGGSTIGSGDKSVSKVHIVNGGELYTLLPSTVAGGTSANATITVAAGSHWTVGDPENTPPIFSTLTLKATNNRLDGGPVAGAHLFVQDTSTVSAGEIIVSAGAELGGTGTCNVGLVSAAGLIAPGDSEFGPAIGTLKVFGNYNASTTADLQIDLGAGTSDMLSVSGLAVLGGTLVVRPNGIKPQLNQQFTILTAGNGVSGKFVAPIEGTPAGNGLIWHVDYSNPNAVILRVIQAQGLAVPGIK